jgi:hypothetical protein
LKGKNYLLVTIIAMIALVLVSLPVKASPYVKFFIVDESGTGIVPAVRLDVGEFIYADLNSPALAKVSAGDKRLSPVWMFDGTDWIYYKAGSSVVAADLDVGTPLKPTGTNWGSIKHVDSIPNVSPTQRYDQGEWIYNDKDASAAVSAGDVRYYPVPGYTLGSTVVATDTDVGKALIAFFSNTASKYERMADNLIANGVYDFAKVLVDVGIDCDLADNSTTGVSGWGFTVQTDPAVLTPVGAIGGEAAGGGYFLQDYIGRASFMYPPAAKLLTSVGSNYMDVTEQLTPSVGVGAGNQSAPPDYIAPPEKLVTLQYSPLSNTTGSAITLVQAARGNYMTADGEWHSVDMISGYYYEITAVPEFPLGIGVLMALAPMIPIIYLWRTRPKRRVTNQ